MPQPPAYLRQHIFLSWSEDFPTTPHSGQHLDDDFNAVKTTIDQVLVNMAVLQRDDGALHNAIVGVETLDAEVLTLMGNWNPRGAWLTATAYAAKDLATQGGQTYVALISHASGVFATDLAANKWMALSSPGILANGSSTITADIPFNAHKLTGVANGTNAQDAVTKSQMDSAVAAGVAAASETVAGKIEIATQAETNTGTDDLRALTPLKLAGSKFNPVGKHTLSIPAAGMTPAPTNGAAIGVIETTTNKVIIAVRDFDATTQEFVGFSTTWPKSADESTITFRARWISSGGTPGAGVAIALEAIGFGDDDATDTAYGTAIQVTDVLLAVGDLQDSAVSAALTIKNLAEGDLVCFRVKRVPADAADTMASDLRLAQIDIDITTSAATDA